MMTENGRKSQLSQENGSYEETNSTLNYDDWKWNGRQTLDENDKIVFNFKLKMIIIKWEN